MPKDGETVKTKGKAGWFRGRRFQIGVTVAIACLTGIILVSGNVKTVVSEDSVRLKSTWWPSKEILFREIRSVELREGFQKGKRVGGFGSLSLSIGSFQNEEFGNYTLYGNNRCSSYVVIGTERGMVVVNEKDEEKTLELYEKIKGGWENGQD